MSTQLAEPVPNAAPPIDPNAPAMPEGGDTKYWDGKVYNYAGHVRELQYQLQQAKSKAPPPAVTTPPPAAEPAGQQPSQAAKLDEAVERGEVNLDALAAEVFAQGDLSAENRAKLAAFGIPKPLVDLHVNNLKASAAKGQDDAYKHLGEGDPEKGKATWTQLNTWAQSNLKPADRDTFNAALRSEGWKAALDLLKARAGLNAPPALLTGSNAATPLVGFKTQQDMVRAINAPDPHDTTKRRYDRDPEYRAQVQARIQAGAARH